MGNADGIEPIFLQYPNPPRLRVRVLTGTKNTVVVVDTAAPEQNLPTIDSQTGFRAPQEFPNTEAENAFIGIRFHKNSI